MSERKNLLEVAQTISLLSTLSEREQDQNVITLSTLHAAKGLEWPHVLLVGVNEGMLPFKLDDDMGRAPATDGTGGALAERLQEERRLMYVGITRAQRSLAVSWTRRRKKGRDTVAAQPSRFIAEMALDAKTSREDPRAKLKALRAEFARRAADSAAAADAAAGAAPRPPAHEAFGCYRFDSCLRWPDKRHSPKRSEFLRRGDGHRGAGRRLPASAAELPVVALYGSWEARIEGLPGTALVRLARHPEYAGGLRGTVERGAATAQLAGDIDDEGRLALDESVDGRAISALWSGDMTAGSCGKEFKGTWRNTATDRSRDFTLRRTRSWQ